MGVVGSLPSPPPSSIVNGNIKVSCKESVPSSNDCNYCVTMMNEIDCNSNSSSNSNTNIDNRNESNNHQCPTQTHPVNVTYGPINVKIRRFVAPTLATGRRSKFMKLEGDAAIKREIRRKRNRDAAKKLKEKRFIIEEQLQKDIRELESKEEELLSRISTLESYKEQLETQYKNSISIQERLVRTATSTLKHIHRNRRRIHHNTPIQRNIIHIKDEPNPPSPPQWQLLFSI
jgi:hypothetical protein